MSKLLIVGCGGHARSVADVFLAGNPEAEILFIDENARPDEKILSFPVVKEVSKELLRENEIFFSAGDNFKRRLDFLQYSGLKIKSIISGSAHIGKGSFLGHGCFIGNFCHIGPEAIIGDNTIINTAAVVEHEVKIGKHCHIGPNATVSGRTIIGNEVFLGVGSTVINNINICDNVIVGAGSTVTRDITEPGTYVGSPVRKVK